MRLDDKFGHDIPPPASGAGYSYNKQSGQQDRLRSKFKYLICVLNKIENKLYRSGVCLEDTAKHWQSSSGELCASSLIYTILCGFLSVEMLDPGFIGDHRLLMISSKNGNGTKSAVGR
jgi:hypothetical protein